MRRGGTPAPRPWPTTVGLSATGGHGDDTESRGVDRPLSNASDPTACGTTSSRQREVGAYAMYRGLGENARAWARQTLPGACGWRPWRSSGGSIVATPVVPLAAFATSLAHSNVASR